MALNVGHVDSDGHKECKTCDKSKGVDRVFSPRPIHQRQESVIVAACRKLRLHIRVVAASINVRRFFET